MIGGVFLKNLAIITIVLTMFVGLLVAGCGGAQQGTKKENWPKGKITVVVPFKAGGSADTMARSLTKYWEKELGAPMIIDNIDGASGQIGATMFQKKPADGNTIFIGTQLYLSANIVLQKAEFKMEDFDILNFQEFDPVTVCVLEDSPYKTLDDLIKAIKDNPNTIKWGTIYGGPLQLAGALLLDDFDLKVKTIYYDSGSAMRTALLGNHIDFMIGNANGDQAVKGKARVLAVADTKRSEIWPEAPTFSEALKAHGKTFPRIGSSRFIAVKKSVKEKYPDRYDKLIATYKKALDNPEYKAFRTQSGSASVTHYYGPEESTKMNNEIHNLLIKYKDKLNKEKLNK